MSNENNIALPGQGNPRCFWCKEPVGGTHGECSNKGKAVE